MTDQDSSNQGGSELVRIGDAWGSYKALHERGPIVVDLTRALQLARR
jgi:hypothetical protein